MQFPSAVVEEWEELEKSELPMLGGTVGASETGNMLGMSVVMSLQLFKAFGSQDLAQHFLTLF